jgi:uncharacterized membrane protein
VGLFAIPEGTQQTLTFPVSASSEAPLGHNDTVALSVCGADRGQYTATSENVVAIGEKPVYKISQGGTIETCTGYFYDSGGETGEYGNGEEYTMTIKPHIPGNVIKVNFDDNFDVEASGTSGCYDYLYVYDGTSTDAPLIDSYCNNNKPGEIKASNEAGALTFKFTSDGSEKHNGWKAEISCSDRDSLIFTVTDGTDSLSGSTVHVGDAKKKTDENGRAVFLKEPGTYYYTALKPGYDTATGSVTVSGITKQPVTLNEITYDITFSIFDERDTSAVEANIIFKDDTVTTTNGSYTFKDLNYEKQVPYRVEANIKEYVTFEDSLDIDSTKSIDVWLETIKYLYNLSVVDQNGKELPEAIVEMGGEQKKTSAEGFASFMLPADMYVCKVSKEGYTSKTTTVNLTDTTKDNVKLLKIYEAAFTVIDSTTGAAIAGASISVDTIVKKTNSSGKASVNLAFGQYDYTIKAEGYMSYSSSLEVNSSISVDAKMEAKSTGMQDLSDAGIIVYPIPSGDLINVEFPEYSGKAIITLQDLTGKIILTEELNNKQQCQINIRGNSPGVYILNVKLDDKVYNQKILIK